MHAPLRLVALLAACVPLAACMTVQGVNETPATATTTAPATVGSNPAPNQPTPTYRREEVLDAAKRTFGGTSEGMARAIERVFGDYGEPVGFIEGEEGSGAFVAGVRYGQGFLNLKSGQRTPLYWQGPSIGYDFGGNATKVFALIYNLAEPRDLYQRFPSVEGSLYVVAGVSVNYLRAGQIVVAPMRSGVGLRAGASVGYVHFTPEPSILPF